MPVNGQPANVYSLLNRRQRGGYRSISSRLEFESVVRGNLSFVQRLNLSQRLEKHTGCVNTVAYNHDGSLILSSGDDCMFGVWCANSLMLKSLITTEHVNNVFSAKFVPHSGDKQIVSCGADGRVLHTNFELDADDPTTTTYADGDRMALRIEFFPYSSSEFFTSHQDGRLTLTDLRAPPTEQKTVVRLAYGHPSGAAFSPLNRHSFALTGSDPYLRIYDIRMFSDSPLDEDDALKMFAPSLSRRHGHAHPTDVRYSADGLLLVNYSSEDVYLFDSSDEPLEDDSMKLVNHVVMCYSGRKNVETFLKEAIFLGGDEYVATGCDSGNIVVWHRRSGTMVNKLRGDRYVVNGLAAHPLLPSMITCGIDNDVKVWSCGEAPYMVLPSSSSVESSVPPWRYRMRHDEEAVVSSREASKRYDDAVVEKQLGNENFGADHINVALSHYKKAEDSLSFFAPSPAMAQKVKALRVVCLLNAAQCHLKLKSWPEAVRACTKALSMQPEEGKVKALYRRAKANVEMEKHSIAMVDIKAALEIDPENTELLHLKRKIAHHVKKEDAKERRVYRHMFSMLQRRNRDDSSDEEDEEEEH